MIANLPWNMANTRSGTPLLLTVLSMLWRNRRPGSQPTPAAQDVRAEGQRVPHDSPQHADDRHGGEAVHHRAQDVLGPDQPPVEHRQARHHQQHQRSGGEHPGRGARVDRGLFRQRRCRRVRERDHDHDAQDEQHRRGRDDGADRVALGGKHPCLLGRSGSPPSPGTTRARRGTWSRSARLPHSARGGTTKLRFSAAPPCRPTHPFDNRHAHAHTPPTGGRGREPSGLH